MRLPLTRLLAAASLPVAVGLCAPALAATNTTADSTPAPTFYREVLPILQENCQECHRSAGTSFGGQLAPMGLETYDEARPWAKSIAKKVESREMPPWDASPQHKGVFLNERSLEDDEIATLVRWASHRRRRRQPEGRAARAGSSSTTTAG